MRREGYTLGGQLAWSTLPVLTCAQISYAFSSSPKLTHQSVDLHPTYDRNLS